MRTNMVTHLIRAETLGPCSGTRVPHPPRPWVTIVAGLKGTKRVHRAICKECEELLFGVRADVEDSPEPSVTVREAIEEAMS